MTVQVGLDTEMATLRAA